MSAAPEVCRKFRNTGKCNFADECKFVHSEGEKITPVREACHSFRDTGDCKYADKCRFLHGDAASGDSESKPKRKALRSRKPKADNNGEAKSAPRQRAPKENLGEERAARARKPRKPRGPKQPGDCHSFQNDGKCDYADKCKFKHGDNDNRDFTQLFKSEQICYRFKNGDECQYGDKCRFTHDMNAPSPDQK